MKVKTERAELLLHLTGSNARANDERFETLRQPTDDRLPAVADVEPVNTWIVLDGDPWRSR